ncbi:MAG: AAA family ATPase [Microscillaceae bacterium]|nr:AAA family ATPase [Microscillaceae bacterium]
MAKRIELFKNILNRRFLYKRMLISKDRGFKFFTGRNKELFPQNLSSGEQHELVLLYQLLFKLSSNALILIDEPEISLHIVWQEQFLNDLQKIIQLRGFDVLIATHSPQIINDRWDLTVELKGTTDWDKLWHAENRSREN